MPDLGFPLGSYGQIAYQNLKDAKALFKSGCYDSMTNSCAQCIEKMAKELYVRQNHIPYSTYIGMMKEVEQDHYVLFLHNLWKIFTYLPNAGWEEHSVLGNTLTDYYFNCRYPSRMFYSVKPDKAKVIMKETMEWVKQLYLMCMELEQQYRIHKTKEFITN